MIFIYIIISYMSSGFSEIVKLSSGIVGSNKKIKITKEDYIKWAKKNKDILKNIEEIVTNQFQLLSVKLGTRRVKRGTRSVKRGTSTRRLRRGTSTRRLRRGGSRTSSPTVKESFKNYIKDHMNWIAPFAISVMTMVIAVIMYNVSAVGYTIMGAAEQQLLNRQTILTDAQAGRSRADADLAAEMRNHPELELKIKGEQQQNLVMIGCATLIIITTILMSGYMYNRSEDRKVKTHANNARHALEQEKMRTGEMIITAPISSDYLENAGFLANRVMRQQQQQQPQLDYGRQPQPLGWY
jgi:hypothetical protein